MDGNQKPFACAVEGCEMTFINEDHLHWHHKKHDMVLNLGLANKSAEVADQTPTPTRFIRNCEEVGLFQDLQNVNPFDETFKKAIECAKTGTLHVPEATTNDDTLHTPHIFPHVENTSSKYIDARSDNQSTPSNDFCITGVTTIEENNDPTDSYDLTIVTDDQTKDKDTNKHNDLKSKLKETIQNKVKTPLIINAVPLERLRPAKRNSPEKKESSNAPVPSKRQRTDQGAAEKIREMNRAAQLRCRKRKQVQWFKMEEELKVLKSENSKLNQENQNFKHKFYALKELLLQHKNSSEGASFFIKVEEILNSSSPPPKKNSTADLSASPKHKKAKTTPVTRPQSIPVAFMQNAAQAGHKPVLIQVLGSVAQLAVSVLPHK